MTFKISNRFYNNIMNYVAKIMIIPFKSNKY